MILKLKDEDKKEKVIIKRKTIEKPSTESFSNPSVEIIDLKKTIGINFIKKEKISRSESCI